MMAGNQKVAEHDEAWLLEMVEGVAAGTHELHIPGSPEDLPPQGVSINAPYVATVAADGGELLPNQDFTQLRVDVVDLDVEDQGRSSPTRQPPAVIDEAAPLGKKRKGVDEGEKRKGKKHKSGTHRSSSSRRNRSLPLDEGFVKRNFEEYVKDPVAAMVNTALNLQDVISAEREDWKARVKEMQQDRDGERRLKDAAQAALIEVRSSLKETEKSLETARNNLRAMEKDKAELEKERGANLERIRTLEGQVTELLQKEKSLGSEVERLTKRVAELEGVVTNASASAGASSESQTRIADLEKRLAAPEERGKKAAQFALGMKEKGFKLAIDQLLVVNPSMIRHAESVLKVNYSVEGGQIVEVDRATKGKTVIYPPST